MQSCCSLEPQTHQPFPAQRAQRLLCLSCIVKCRTLFQRSKRRESGLFGKGERTRLHRNILGDSKSDQIEVRRLWPRITGMELPFLIDKDEQVQNLRTVTTEYPMTIHSETLCTCNVDNKHMRTTPQPIDSTPLLPNLELDFKPSCLGECRGSSPSQSSNC